MLRRLIGAYFLLNYKLPVCDVGVSSLLSIFTSRILLVKVHGIFAHFEIVFPSCSGRRFAEVRMYKAQQKFKKHTEWRDYCRPFSFSRQFLRSISSNCCFITVRTSKVRVQLLCVGRVWRRFRPHSWLRNTTISCATINRSGLYTICP